METKPALNDNASVAIPTIDELAQNDDMSLKNNALMVLLNQPPKPQWLKHHPIAKMKNDKGENVPLPYLPIERVEWLLSYIYTKWWVEVRDVKIITNSVVVTVRLYVVNPLDKSVEYQDGVGASPIQTNAGAAASDFMQVKANGVQIATPAAKSYAVKDAAEGFGKLFGKDVGRAVNLSYDAFLKGDAVTLEELTELYELKKDSPLLTAKDHDNINRIIDPANPEKKSFSKIHSQLMEA